MKDNNMYMSRIIEPAVIECCKNYFWDNFDNFDILKYKINEFGKSDSKGFGVEYVYAELLGLEKHQGKFINEMSFIKNIKNLPKWTGELKWNMEFLSINDEKYFENIDKMYGKLVHLSNSFHGDLFCLWKFNGIYYYFILSSKLFSSPMSKEKVDKSQNSTILSKAYHNSYVSKPTPFKTHKKK